jgi:hypothetical protein
MPLSDKRESWFLLVQDNAQEGFVDVDLAIVLDKAQFSEFVHEKIDPGTRCANHLRQRLLGYIGNHLLRLVLRPISRKQQQSTRQPFFAGVEELVYQVLFDPGVSSQRVRDEAIGKLVLLVEHPNHFVFLNDENGGERNRGRSGHANGLASKASFSKKITGSENRYDGFFASLINYCKLDAAFLNVHDVLRGIALREDGFFFLKLGYLPAQTGGVEKRLRIENRAS